MIWSRTGRSVEALHDLMPHRIAVHSGVVQGRNMARRMDVFGDHPALTFQKRDLFRPQAVDVTRMLWRASSTLIMTRNITANWSALEQESRIIAEESLHIFQETPTSCYDSGSEAPCHPVKTRQARRGAQPTCP